MTKQPGTADNPSQDGPGFAMPAFGTSGEPPLAGAQPSASPSAPTPSPIVQPSASPQQPAAGGWQPPQNPQPWAHPAPGQQPYWQQTQPAPTNGLAIAALVAAIFAAPVGIVLGIIALSQIKKSNGAQGGQGLAIAGIVLGSVMTLAAFVPLLIIAIAFMGSSSDGVGAMAGLL